LPVPGIYEMSSDHGGHSFPFLEQLKRRNVGRVAVLYIGLAYLLLEVFQVFFFLLEMPPWTGKLAVLVVAVGFPAALIFAWVYEVTPEGLKLSQEVEPDKSITKTTGRKLDRAIIAVLAVALSYFVVDKFWISRSATVVAQGEHAEDKATNAKGTEQAVDAAVPVVSDKSVAVLAFTNLSSDKDQEFFSDGLAEELTDLLSRIPGLHVSGRTSSFYFKGKQATVEEIGKALHVANVLEGSVRRSGNRLRVTTQLIRCKDNEHLWSETYERAMQDVFKVQDEIAGAVTAALKVQLGMGRRGTPYRPNDSEAHLQFLLGEQLSYKSTEDSYRQAILAYKKAIDLDPRYAAAYAGLSFAEYYLADETGNEAFKRDAITHASKAIDIDPQEPYGYLARGRLEESDFKWRAALADSNKALELDPDNGAAYRRRSIQVLVVGNTPAAIDDAKKAVTFDPLNAGGWNELGLTLVAAGRYAEARSAFERGIAVDAASPLVLYNYAVLDLVEGKYAHAQELCRVNADEVFQSTCQVMAHHSLGHNQESLAALKTLADRHALDSAYQIAEAHAWRGEKEPAFQWLDRAIEQKDGGLDLLPFDPLLRSLQSDMRYKGLLRKINIPEQN